eukprot:gene3441-20082_t
MADLLCRMKDLPAADFPDNTRTPLEVAQKTNCNVRCTVERTCETHPAESQGGGAEGAREAGLAGLPSTKLKVHEMQGWSWQDCKRRQVNDSSEIGDITVRRKIVVISVAIHGHFAVTREMTNTGTANLMMCPSKPTCRPSKYMRILYDFKCKPPPREPNIVIILADDVGIGDITAYDLTAPVPTPNIDALAAAGTILHDAHAQGKNWKKVAEHFDERSD